MRKRRLITVLAGAAVLGAVVVTTTANSDSPASAGAATLTYQQEQAIVSQFATTLVRDDHAGLVAITTPDMTWTIPGHSKISGRTVGQVGVLRLADTFTHYELHISVQALTFGPGSTVAVEVRDTGDHNGRTLDQNVVNILTIRDGKIASAEGNFADVSAFNAYFS